jgi:protein gp37
MNLQKPKAGIEWTHVPGYRGATANPVSGCQHECRWRMPNGKIAKCYAEEIAERFPGQRYAQGFKHLSFHPAELEQISQAAEPHAIFIDSMADLFGSGVDASWIMETLQCASDNPQHLFLSLTKNPGRLPRFGPFPPNWWLGVSAPPTFMFGKELSLDQQRTWFRNALKQLTQCEAAVRWVSLEPLSFDLSDILAEFADKLNWAVIGAASNGATKFQPDRDTFRNVMNVLTRAGVDVFFKGNLDRALATDVAGGWLECFPERSALRVPHSAL